MNNQQSNINNLNVSKLSEQISFQSMPVKDKTVKIEVSGGKYLTELAVTYVDRLFTIPGAAFTFTSKQFVKYVKYLMQERVKQVNRQSYDRDLYIPSCIFACIGSIYRYYDKVKGIAYVPEYKDDPITRDSDIEKVYKGIFMCKKLNYATSMPYETEGSSPSSLWVTTEGDEVKACDEVVLTDALFTCVCKKYSTDLDYRVGYGGVSQLRTGIWAMAELD